MKRAVIVITDAKSIEVVEWGETDGTWMGEVQPTEQLLADLDSVLGLASIGVLELRGAHREDAEEQIERVRVAIGEDL